MLQNMILVIRDKWDRSEEESSNRLEEWRHWVANKRIQIEGEVIGSNLNQLKEQQRKFDEFRYETHLNSLFMFMFRLHRVSTFNV